MLEKYNEEINIQREKMAKKKRLEGVLNRLNAQKGELDSKVSELDNIRIKEDKDVAKLEKISLSGLLLSMVGKKEERLDKEKREAYAATIKYNEAKSELDALIGEISTAEAEYRIVRNSDKAYKQAVDNKINFMKMSGTDEGNLLIEYENKILEHDRMIKEYTEAIGACKRAMASGSRACDALNKANSWSTWDVLGGDMFSDMAKHSYIDEASRFMSMLQNDLGRLKSELLDIDIPLHMDTDVRVSGGLKVADFLFDGLFADLAVKGHIKDSYNKVSDIQKEIMDISAKVTYRLDNEKKQRDICQKKINEIVL